MKPSSPAIAVDSEDEDEDATGALVYRLSLTAMIRAAVALAAKNKTNENRSATAVAASSSLSLSSPSPSPSPAEKRRVPLPGPQILVNGAGGNTNEPAIGRSTGAILHDVDSNEDVIEVSSHSNNCRMSPDSKPFDTPSSIPTSVPMTSKPTCTPSSKSTSTVRQLHKEHGDFGSYDRTVDERGNRQGWGKMTYISGACYLGGFVDDKFHDDDSVYRWADGDEYMGSWRNGERHGIGTFRSRDGSVIYSEYDMGVARGEGLLWTADRKAVHKTIGGVAKMRLTNEQAAKYAKKWFGGLPVVPDPHDPVITRVETAVSPGKSDLLASASLSKCGLPMDNDHSGLDRHDKATRDQIPAASKIKRRVGTNKKIKQPPMPIIVDNSPYLEQQSLEHMPRSRVVELDQKKTASRIESAPSLVTKDKGIKKRALVSSSDACHSSSPNKYATIRPNLPSAMSSVDYIDRDGHSPFMAFDYDDGLPDGWEAKIDPRSGKPFYIDHGTKSTTWARPTWVRPPPPTKLYDGLDLRNDAKYRLRYPSNSEPPPPTQQYPDLSSDGKYYAHFPSNSSEPNRLVLHHYHYHMFHPLEFSKNPYGEESYPHQSVMIPRRKARGQPPVIQRINTK